MISNKTERADSKEDNCEIRNKQIQELIDGMSFIQKDLDLTAEFEYIFWMGDMNYRLENLDFDDGVKLSLDGNVCTT